MVSGTGPTQPARTRTTVTEDFTRTQLALAANRREDEKLLLAKDALDAKRQAAKSAEYDLYKKDLIDTTKAYKDFQVGTAVSAKNANDTYGRVAYDLNIAVQNGTVSPEDFSRWKSNAQSSMLSHNEAVNRVLKFNESLRTTDGGKYKKEEFSKAQNDFNEWTKISGNWNFNEKTGQVEYYDEKGKTISMDEFFEGTIPPDMKEMRVNQLDVLDGKIGKSVFAQDLFVKRDPVTGVASLDTSPLNIDRAMNTSKLFMGADYGYIEENIEEDYIDANFPDAEGQLSKEQQAQVDANGTKYTTDGIVNLYTEYAQTRINKINSDLAKQKKKDSGKPSLYVLEPFEESFGDVTSRGVTVSPNAQRVTSQPSDAIGGLRVQTSEGRPVFNEQGDLVLTGYQEAFAQEKQDGGELAKTEKTKDDLAYSSVNGFVKYVEKLDTPQYGAKDILVTVTVPRTAYDLSNPGEAGNLLSVGKATDYTLLVTELELQRMAGRIEGLDEHIKGGNMQTPEDAKGADKGMTKEQEDMLKTEAEETTYVIEGYGDEPFTKKQLIDAGWTEDQLKELKPTQ